MLSVTDYIIYGFGLVILAAWLFFFAKGLKYADLFETLEEKEYPLKELYGLGYGVMETIRYPYKSKHDRKIRRELEILYGEKYTEYFLRVTYAQKVTLSFTLLAMAVPFYGFSNDVIMVLMFLVLAVTIYYYYGTLVDEKIKKRSEQMLSDFSNVVSKLALLTNAGMILHEAWEEVAYTGDTEIYREMQLTVEQMNNGVAEVDALYQFGARSVVPEIKKFTSTIVQGISKGNSELVGMLQEQSKEVWSLKKQLVRRQGEKAASKLIIPLTIMFVGILIMVIVPIFTNMGI